MISNFYSRKQIGAIPHYQRRGHFLNTQDIAAYNVLTKAFDDYINIFPKVALAELIVRFRPQKDQVKHWSRVQLRRIDFLVCAGLEMEPILAINIVSQSNIERRQFGGRDVIEDVLEDIGLPLLRLRAQDKYDLAEVTRRVNLAIQEHQSATAIRRKEESVLDTTMPSGYLDEFSNSALSSTLRFLTGIRDKYREHVGRPPTNTPQ